MDFSRKAEFQHYCCKDSADGMVHKMVECQCPNEDEV